MRIRRLIVLVIVCSVRGENKTDNDVFRGAKKMFDKLDVVDCLNSDSKASCFASKAALTIENSMNHNIPLFGDIQLLRNTEQINLRRPKSLDPIDRFLRAISDFIDTHTFSIDLTNSIARELKEEVQLEKSEREGGGGGGGGNKGGGGGGGMFSMAGMQKEKRYYQYAFMVLLGIFGLTGPLVMKILGIMAAKSLLAAKAALIIVGSVALKKLFEKGHEKPKIKVTTLPIHYDDDDEHDRLSYGFNHIPYGYAAYRYNPHNDPYSAYFSENSVNENEEFAPVMYGKKTNS